MSHIDGETTFKLRKEVEYSSNGEFVKAGSVILREPDGKKRRYCNRMKKLIASAQRDTLKALSEVMTDEVKEAVDDFAKKKDFIEKKDDEFISESENMRDMIETSLNMSDDEEILEKFTQAFEAMISSNGSKVAFLAEGVPMMADHFEKMHWEDQTDIAIWYAAFFGIASDKRQSKASGNQSELLTEVKDL